MSTLELKVDKNRLDLKFEGYKLSLDSIPILKQAIPEGVECFELKTDKDYSYLHFRMSSLLNHLFSDPWNSNNVFYVTENQRVLWTGLQQDGRLANQRAVWQLPESCGGRCDNASLAFPGLDFVVLSDGRHNLFVLHTTSRAAGEPWTCVYTHSFDETTSPNYVLHAVNHSIPSGHQIDCLIATVVRKSDVSELIAAPESTTFVALLQWLTFTCDQNHSGWSMKRERKLLSTSSPEYAAIDCNGDAVCVIAQNEYKLVFDSKRPHVEVMQVDNVTEEPKGPLYTYIQTAEDITVVFRLPTDVGKSEVEVNILPLQMEVLLRGKCVLKGQLANRVDGSSSTWIIDKEKLEVSLSKAEVGLMWKELVKDDKRGEELMDPALLAEIHSRLAHLTSENEANPSDKVPFNLQQLEECDSSIEPLIFQRIDGNDHSQTHQVNLGGHQWLFQQQICPESLPTFCLRHDVDGILWQPKNTCSEGELENFKLEHLATFPALGYVLASKQNRKFVTCAPDFSFSVISECVRRIYVYCQSENLHSTLELRNRVTGKSISHIAKQYVLSLEECDKILGMQVSSQCIFVLSKKKLYAVKMNLM